MINGGIWLTTDAVSEDGCRRRNRVWSCLTYISKSCSVLTSNTSLNSLSEKIEISTQCYSRADSHLRKPLHLFQLPSTCVLSLMNFTSISTGKEWQGRIPLYSHSLAEFLVVITVDFCNCQPILHILCQFSPYWRQVLAVATPRVFSFRTVSIMKGSPRTMARRISQIQVPRWLLSPTMLGSVTGLVRQYCIQAWEIPVPVEKVVLLEMLPSQSVQHVRQWKLWANPIHGILWI